MDNRHPEGISHLTGFERRLWGSTLERQYADRQSRYWANVERYGDTGSTYLSVGWLWLLLGNVFLVPVIVTWIFGGGLSGVILLVICLLIGTVAFVRFLTAATAGKRFRRGSPS